MEILGEILVEVLGEVAGKILLGVVGEVPTPSLLLSLHLQSRNLTLPLFVCCDALDFGIQQSIVKSSSFQSLVEFTPSQVYFICISTTIRLCTGSSQSNQSKHI